MNKRGGGVVFPIKRSDFLEKKMEFCLVLECFERGENRFFWVSRAWGPKIVLSGGWDDSEVLGVEKIM